MPPMVAPFISKKVAAVTLDVEAPTQLPWRPISQQISISRDPPTPTGYDEGQQRAKRDVLAANAHARYEDWRKENPQPSTHSSSSTAVAKPN